MNQHAQERVLAVAVEGIAAGASRGEVCGTVRRLFGRQVSYSRITQLVKEALPEARAQGVERSDIDDSWYTEGRP